MHDKNGMPLEQINQALVASAKALAKCHYRNQKFNKRQTIFDLSRTCK